MNSQNRYTSQVAPIYEDTEEGTSETTSNNRLSMLSALKNTENMRGTDVARQTINMQIYNRHGNSTVLKKSAIESRPKVDLKRSLINFSPETKRRSVLQNDPSQITVENYDASENSFDYKDRSRGEIGKSAEGIQVVPMGNQSLEELAKAKKHT